MAGLKTSIDDWLRAQMRPLLRRLLKSVSQRLDMHQQLGVDQRDANLRTRAAIKRRTGQPIRVVFACHGRAMWPLFESVYAQACRDPALQPVVLALPYRHSTLPAGQYRDERIADFLRPLGIPVVEAVDRNTGVWLEPRDLDADYVFFQTPYRLYADSWNVERVAVHARVCYIPYGCTLFSGSVDSVSHPEPFFRHVSLTFTENAHGQRLFEEKFRNAPWYRQSSFVLTGYPKLDHMQARAPTPRGVWKRPSGEAALRILWTPRWRTEEGNCHFFDYKDVLFDFCRDRTDRELVFRPHPLCLQNFIKTGELTAEQLGSLRDGYAGSPNMVLDESGDYRSTFLSSDVLVSDVSSMLFEYFATGKPIVYTHRVDVFNDLGRTLSEGFYWVRDADELRSTLEKLQQGNDPLAERRRELIDTVVRMAPDSAGGAVVRALKRDFFADTLGERLTEAEAALPSGGAMQSAPEARHQPQPTPAGSE